METVACLFFYRHAGPNGPEEASIGKNARCAGDNLVNLVKMADQANLKRDNQENLIVLTGVTVLIDVTVEILLLLQTIGIAGDRPPRYGKK